MLQSNFTSSPDLKQLLWLGVFTFANKCCCIQDSCDELPSCGVWTNIFNMWRFIWCCCGVFKFMCIILLLISSACVLCKVCNIVKIKTKLQKCCCVCVVVTFKLCFQTVICWKAKTFLKLVFLQTWVLSSALNAVNETTNYFGIFGTSVFANTSAIDCTPRGAWNNKLLLIFLEWDNFWN